MLLGPSGCGKTTTLRMVAGLEIPTAGQVRLDGKDVTSLRPAERDVGFVFQFYALYPHMPVRENIAFPLRNTGMPPDERERTMSEVVKRLGLTDLLDRYPRQLSGGDQQRVALARAMVRRPALYLMDEPLGTLDADLRLEMRVFLREQQLELKVTTLYVTHDQEEAMGLADRIVVMDAGLICQVGSPTDVYDDPASLFVAHFVGSPGMNIVEGKIEHRDGHSVFSAPGSEQTVHLGDDVAPGNVTLGIRAEHVSVHPEGELTGRVVLNEYRGVGRNIHVDTSFGRMILSAGPEAGGVVGDEVRLRLDPENTRLFDSETGRRR